MSSYIQLDLIVENRSSFTKARQAPGVTQCHQMYFKTQKKHHLHDYDSYWLRVQADFQRDAHGGGYDFLLYFL